MKSALTLEELSEVFAELEGTVTEEIWRAASEFEIVLPEEATVLRGVRRGTWIPD